MIKLSDYVLAYISGLGVKNIFLLPGGGCMHLVDSLGRRRDMDYVCCLHEQAAVIAADAGAQYTGHLGVVLVTTGPGGTNAVTGVAGAWIDSVPLLVLSGQVKRPDLIAGSGLRQRGVQEVDIVSLVKSITKYAVTVEEPSSIRYHLEKAVYLAKTGRPGPVWIDIPLDVQATMIDESSLGGFECPENSMHQDDKTMAFLADQALALLNSSQRPVILAGNGIRSAQGLTEFLRLVDILRIPVLTTWKAIDFLPEEHECYFGRPGSIGQRAANFIQQNSDLIMVLGARLDLAQVGYDYQNFARAAKKIIVDIDQAELNKLKMEIDVRVPGDVKAFLSELIRRRESIKEVPWTDWMARCRQWKEKYPVVLPQYWREEKYVNTYVLVDVLSELLTGEDVIVPGSSGSCSEITMQAFRVKAGQRIFNNPGLGAMGYGLPASIGACLASGGRRTVTIIGDGGLQHNIQELQTVARLQLPLKIFVLNNNGYASIRNTQRSYFNGQLVACDPSSGLSLPDIRALASAYGLRSQKITGHQNIRHEVGDVLSFAGPCVCEVMVDPDLVTAPRLSSEVKSDGTIVSKPLEDLWPFLDRDEFRSNMLIPPVGS